MNKVDGRVPSTRRCRCARSDGSCKHITFDKEIDPTSYWRELAPRDPLQGSSAIKPNAIGLNVSRSLHSLTATPSSLPRKSDTITQDLKFVELDFRTIEDKMSFREAYDTLRRLAELDGFRRQTRTLLGEKRLPSNHRSPSEQGSLTRKYESAAVDAGNTTSTVVQKGDNTEIMPFYKTKVEEGDSLAPLPHSPPAPARDSSSNISERPGPLTFDVGRLSPNIKLDNRKRSSNVSDDRQKESIRPSVDEDIRYADRILGLLNKTQPPISLQCPFHFLGCKKEFHISQERRWVEHSLTHFQKAGRRGGSVRTVEPPTSCLCYFCEREFSGLTGAACWKNYMNHIARCVLGNGRVPPDFTLIEYLWQRGLINVGEYRDLKPNKGIDVPAPPALTVDEEPVVASLGEQRHRRNKRASIETSTKREQNQGLRSEHPPFSMFEQIPGKVSELIESEPSALSVRENSGDEKQDSRSETQISREIKRASIETSAKKEQRRRRICRRIVVFMLWKMEQDVCIPGELWSSPASFEFIDVLETSTFDEIKSLFEAYSGREWNWWPFSAPVKPLESGKVRIRWQCVGELSSSYTMC